MLVTFFFPCVLHLQPNQKDCHALSTPIPSDIRSPQYQRVSYSSHVMQRGVLVEGKGFTSNKGNGDRNISFATSN